MRNFAIVVMIMSVAGTGWCDTPDALVESEAGRAFLNKVLRDGSWGLARDEHAAFIVTREDGSLGCLAWPSTHTELAEKFYGSLPARIVAIIHTHPMAWPYPSPGDLAVATRLRIPVYVVTPRRITKAMPSEQWPVEVARNPRWLTGQPVEAFRCEAAPRLRAAQSQ